MSIPEVTSEMLDAGMAVVWGTDIMHPSENELREMLREAYIVMSRMQLNASSFPSVLCLETGRLGSAPEWIACHGAKGPS
jgi:hypothetical protein